MTGNAHTVGILAIGDELLAGAHPDLNSPQVGQCVAEYGRRVARIAIVSDDEGAIADAIAGLAAEHPLVVTTGGLGPTLDDVTRHGAARAAGRELVHSEEAMAQVADWFARADREMPVSNDRQALVPAGATVLLNARGTAPGFRSDVGDSTLFVLPGPPYELAGMIEDHLRPWLAEHPVGEEAYAVRRFHLADLSEGVFADRAGNWMERFANPRMGVTAKGGILSVRIVGRAVETVEAHALVDRRADEFVERFGERVFSEDESELALVLGRELVRRGITVATAESCTGGLVAAELTRVPGISAVFREGFVTYTNEAKVERLGVPRELIEAHGAVSAEVAEAMARGAAERSGARLAVGVTGIAGPGGGSEAKPVGLVWFGIALDGRVTSAERTWPDGGRDKIREWAVTKALSLLLSALPGE